MQLLNWVLGKKKATKSFICGGETSVLVTDIYGSIKAKIYYKRPTSDEILSYSWDLKSAMDGESELRQIKDSKNTAMQMHKTICEKVMIPYAEKIFVKADGYSYNDIPIESFDQSKQFDILKEYYFYHLVQMSEKAFDTNCLVKKNS